MIHVLYLDDSGSSGNKDEEYLVLGGVCVPEKSLRWLSNQLNELVQRFAKDSPQTVEFHAVDIFGGRSGIWRQYKDRQSRVNIIKQVLCVLDNAYREVHTYACAVHKPSCAGDPLHEAYETISSRFDSYLKGLNEEPAIREHKAEAHRDLIVMDKSTYELSLQSLAANIRQDGNRWGQYLTGICEVPLFVDSRSSRIVQLADHVAYAVFRRYNAGDLTYYNCIESRFYQRDGIMQSLVHYGPEGQVCTCPACWSKNSR